MNERNGEYQDMSEEPPDEEEIPEAMAKFAVIGPERKNSLLTSTNREFLTGHKEYDSRQRRYEQRKSIRERVVAGIRDLPLLLWLDNNEREWVLDELDDEEFERYVTAFLEFVYEMLDYDSAELENIITSAVSHAEQEREMGDRLKAVDTTIGIDYSPDPKAIYERFQSEGPHALTPAEIGILVRKGLIQENDLETLETPFGELHPNGPYPYSAPQETDENQ